MEATDRKRIAVVDENSFIARQVGHLIEQTGHRAVFCRTRTSPPEWPPGGDPDMVLIGQRSREDGGWTCFNQWQETNPALPLMLYVLDDGRPERLSILRKALHQALADAARPRNPVACRAAPAAESGHSW